MAYTAGDHIFSAIMTTESGLPEDKIVNTFALKHNAGTPNAGDFADAHQAISDFYDDGAGATNTIRNYISPFVDRGATHRITATHITAPPLGSPVYDAAWLGPAAPGIDDALPEECAGVLSFHADLTGIAEEVGVTRPKARRRGRLYIGPLTLEAVDYDVFPVRLKASFTGALRSAATRFIDQLDAAGWTWCVWSRSDATLRPVVGGWTDNAPDTQRRRGPAASNRTTWTA